MKPSCTFALLTFLSAAFAAPTSASTLYVDLGLASIPSTITLCRDADNMELFPVDHQWQIGFNLDGNVETGDPTSGNEVLLVVQTLQQSEGCAPNNVPAQGAFVSAMFLWNTSLGDWEYARPAAVSVDLFFATLRVTIDDSALSPYGVMGVARIDAVAAAGYSVGSKVTYAFDSVSAFSRGLSPSVGVSDPAADVQNCEDICSSSSNWYPLIDVRSLEVSGVVDHFFVAGFE